MGASLEEFVKNLFAGNLCCEDFSLSTERLAETFSYLGNQNNPPDAILREGDGIEIKKVENIKSSLALNSSYPKRQLFASDPMISNACRSCEQWEVKDIIYVVGLVSARRLRALAMVYGDVYCASADTYLRVKKHIKEGVEQINGVEFAPTRELGRVNQVDPLGITYLRVRGMWGIENPFTLFRDLYAVDPDNDFDLLVVMGEDKYNSMDNVHLLESLTRRNPRIAIRSAKVREPDNPACLKNVRCITYKLP